MVPEHANDGWLVRVVVLFCSFRECITDAVKHRVVAPVRNFLPKTLFFPEMEDVVTRSCRHFSFYIIQVAVGDFPGIIQAA